MSSAELLRHHAVRTAVVLLAAAPLLGCDPPRKCLRTETQTIITYPNMGLLALGPQYTAVALMPVAEQQEVCAEYEGNAALKARAPAQALNRGDADVLR